MTSHPIALITDSTCDIPAELRQQYQIGIIPLTVVWGGRQMLDGVELSAEAFYERLVKDPEFPTTSQPSPRQFFDAFKAQQAAGAREIVVITISSAMSGTIESARRAAEMIDIPIHIVDSKSNSMSLGWQVLAAARAREAGGDAAAMIAAANRARERMVYIIVLDTMDYLYKGGRIGGAVRFLGSLLKIKPQITVNHETGKVEAGIPARSRESAINGLVRDFFRRLNPQGRLHLAVLHNAAYEDAQTLAEQMRRDHAPAELVMSIVSPCLGVHTGPRAIALCGYTEE
ncbi:MAG TPA: DegV family protein [Anaerolineaceae bacterium]|jgi:DegV family protein with EDD domain|nr:DegV family protein [Anaerolineaceae bacterium]